MNQFWLKLLSWVRIRQAIGGLEISDGVLRYAKWNGSAWMTSALRLPPGILSGGRVQDKAGFLAALTEFRGQILNGRKGALDVVASLGSMNVYSQVFSLPLIEGQNLEKAIQLNLQMSSPDKSKESYSGWQTIGEDQAAVRLEILSAFVSKEVVDELNGLLKQAGFMVHSLEPRAFSVARAVRVLGDGFDAKGSYLCVVLDEEGMEFIVLRRNQLYFQYFMSWSDVAQGEKEVSDERFRSALLRSFNQVFNFYTSHWGEPLTAVWLAGSALRDKVLETLQPNFQLPFQDLRLRDMELDPEWLVVLGSALRGYLPQAEDKEISLLGISAQEEFREHQILNFLGFWNVLLPVSLSVMLLVLGGADFFLRSSAEDLKERVVASSGTQVQEMNALQARLTQFNRSVTLIDQVMRETPPLYRILDSLIQIMRQNRITPVRLTMNGSGSANLNAMADSEENIAAFAEALRGNARYSNVNYPLNEIRSSPQGSSFTMTFSISRNTD